jgi:iron complex transport system permease protein
MSSDARFAFVWPPIVLILVAAATPWFGAEIVSPASLTDASEYDIFVQFRLSRMALGALAGAALSIAGCLFQAVLRNPLASPYTLGVSSGASLGAVIAIVFDFAWVWSGSVVGALVALIIIAGAVARQRTMTATSLILAGVSVNSVCLALIILLQSMAGFSKSFAVTTWLIGALDALSPTALLAYACVSLPLAAWIIRKAPDWDLLSLGEAWAAARGVRVRRLLWQACLVGSLLTAVTVSLTGPIGFIGLMVPHMVRRFSGAGHRRLLPASFFYGATFLVICDAAARTLLRPTEIPVGVITALIGGPGLIWILQTARTDH